MSQDNANESFSNVDNLKEHSRGRSYASPPKKRSPSPHYEKRAQLGRGRHDQPQSKRLHSSRASIEQLAVADKFLSLKEFLEYQDPSIDEIIAIDSYKRYKNEFFKAHLVSFFEIHKTEHWFRELYHPSELVEVKDQVRLEASHRCASFTEDFNSGKWNNLSLDEPEKLTNVSKSDNSFESISFSEKEDSASFFQIEAVPEFQDAMTKSGPCVLIIKSIPPRISRKQIIDMCKSCHGYERTSFGEPNPSKKFHRVAWVHFSIGTDMNAVLDYMEKSAIDEFEFHFGVHRPTEMRFKSSPEISNTEERIKADFYLAKKLAIELDKSRSLDGKLLESLGLADDPQNIKKSLDIVIIYLRRVHFFCYYCGQGFDNEEDLIRKCGNIHVRKSKDYPSSMKSEAHILKWVHDLEERINAKINHTPPFEFEPRTATRVLNGLISKVEEGKYRCIVCSKLFRGPEFVEKHLNLKHEDKIADAGNEAELFNNFIVNPTPLIISVISAPQVPPTNPSSTGISNARRISPPPLRDRFGRDIAPERERERDYEQDRDRDRDGRNYSYQDRPRHREPIDRRTTRSYFDLDAPAEGDVEIDYS